MIYPEYCRMVFRQSSTVFRGWVTYNSFTVNRITRWKPALAHLCSSTLYLWISRPKLGWRRLKGAEWRICSPVTAMLLPLALLFLTCQARGSPTLVEFINSGLSIIGAKYVPPESQETVVVTRQSSCRDCSRQVCNTSDQTASQTACTGKICVWNIYNNNSGTSAALLSGDIRLRQVRRWKDKTDHRWSWNGRRSLPLDCGAQL